MKTGNAPESASRHLFPLSLQRPLCRSNAVNRLEPPCTDPYARWCGRGRRVTAAPMPIKSLYPGQSVGRTTTVSVNRLSRKILIQLSLKRLKRRHIYALNHIFVITRQRKEIFFVRGIARQKLGYYPLPQNEAERIRRFLSFQGDAVSVLDPCAGGGSAMATITSGAKTVRHAIELDAFRAEEFAAPRCLCFDSVWKRRHSLYITP
jgi:Uncharacterised methyltransferase family (DUF6094)